MKNLYLLGCLLLLVASCSTVQDVSFQSKKWSPSKSYGPGGKIIYAQTEVVPNDLVEVDTQEQEAIAKEDLGLEDNRGVRTRHSLTSHSITAQGIFPEAAFLKMGELRKDKGEDTATNTSNGFASEDLYAIIGFCLAIVGGFAPSVAIGILAMVSALVLSIIGLKSKKYKWMAIVGLVISAIVLILLSAAAVVATA